MQGRRSVSLAAMMFAVALMITAATPAAAGKLPPGVSSQVLAEFPSDVPGIEKIVLVELRVEPGAKRENFAPEATVL